MSLIESARQYVHDRIAPEFHDKRIVKLRQLKLAQVLKRKNPYLFRAKAIVAAPDLVKHLLRAYLSSQEETIFGDFLEGLAIHICSQAYGGHKSTTEGVDLEFVRDGVRYIVDIKSGPNWGNASQIKKCSRTLIAPGELRVAVDASSLSTAVVMGKMPSPRKPGGTTSSSVGRTSGI